MFTIQLQLYAKLRLGIFYSNMNDFLLFRYFIQRQKLNIITPSISIIIHCTDKFKKKQNGGNLRVIVLLI